MYFIWPNIIHFGYLINEKYIYSKPQPCKILLEAILFFNIIEHSSPSTINQYQKYHNTLCPSRNFHNNSFYFLLRPTMIQREM